MKPPYRLFGAALSPYSAKVRSYLRYKGLEHEWIERSQSREEEFQRYAKLQLIPILVDADDAVMQDSTPIIEALERAHGEPALQPAEAGLAFLSALLEDYADEWLNKAMFHYRWSYPDDQESAAKRIVAMMFDGAGAAPEGLEASVRARMSGRLHHVGSSPETQPIIEASFERVIALLDPVLANRSYLFGGRPCLADFGIAAQLAQLLSDPTPGALLRGRAPNVVRWVERMEAPQAQGDFIPFASAAEDFAELLRTEVASVYLRWMEANARAVADDAGRFQVEIDGRAFNQKPQRYAAKALAALQRTYTGLSDHAALAALLQATGCASVLGAANDDEDETDADGEESPAGDEPAPEHSAE